MRMGEEGKGESEGEPAGAREEGRRASMGWRIHARVRGRERERGGGENMRTMLGNDCWRRFGELLECLRK